MINPESSREIYWNVGHGVIAPMYLFVIAALGIMLYGFYSRLKVYRLGAPLGRLDNLLSRLLDFLKNTFTQIKVLRETGAGAPHALFFWSFILLFIGTTLIFVQEDITGPLFDIHFLQGGFYKLFSLTLDIAGAVAIIALLRLFVRRYVTRPEGLVTSGDDLLIAGLLFSILITGFIIEGLRISATELLSNPDLALFSPVGFVVGKMLSGLDDGSLRSAHFYLWWIHFAIVIGFFVSIPFTKLRHLFRAQL